MAVAVDTWGTVAVGMAWGGSGVAVDVNVGWWGKRAGVNACRMIHDHTLEKGAMGQNNHIQGLGCRWVEARPFRFHIQHTSKGTSQNEAPQAHSLTATLH